MSALALGWCRAPKTVPDEMFVTQAGKLTVIAAPMHLVSAPRQRMRAQVACFEAGMDLIPTAPANPLTLEEARAVADDQTNALRGALLATAGCGQLSLRATLHPTSEPRKVSDEGWLRGRSRINQSRQATTQQLAGILRRLCDGLGTASTITHKKSTHSASCHILVRRGDVARVKERINQNAAHDANPLESLCVTGLWPPYAFTQSTEHPRWKVTA